MTNTDSNTNTPNDTREPAERPFKVEGFGYMAEETPEVMTSSVAELRVHICNSEDTLKIAQLLSDLRHSRVEPKMFYTKMVSDIIRSGTKTDFHISFFRGEIDDYVINFHFNDSFCDLQVSVTRHEGIVDGDIDTGEIVTIIDRKLVTDHKELRDLLLPYVS